jgi:CHAT domain
LKLNADLVVLSACRMRAGEGVGSMARAFFYAGCKGVVCSLWSVDDEATADLMHATYRGLNEGLSTAESLPAGAVERQKGKLPPVQLKRLSGWPAPARRPSACCAPTRRTHRRRA